MNNANNDPIANALGVTPLLNSLSVKNMITDAHNDSAKNDFETARANIHEVIQNGQEAMFKLGEIANSSQHPRAFEVLAKLMETMLQANKDLMELQSKIREINSADAPMNEHAKTINNNLFVGSTSELQKMIENMKNGGSAI
jgi:transcriptional regulator with AAA-type ATPase domain